MFTPHGSYAEYAIAPAGTTFKLPPNVTFEEGATMPLASMTAALALYQHLHLPLPWDTNSKAGETPVLIYGGASAVGAFALKFAKVSGLNPIITVAGNGIEYVKSLDAATHIIDYRNGNVVEDILRALDGKILTHAFDAISSKESWKTILAVFADSRNGSGKGGHINMVDPPSTNPFPTQPEGPMDWGFPENVRFSRTFVSSAYGKEHVYRSEANAQKDGDFAYVWYRYMGRLLAEGKLKAHPYEVMPNGLESVGEGVKRLCENKISAKKLVYRVADTTGAGKE